MNWTALGHKIFVADLRRPNALCSDDRDRRDRRLGPLKHILSLPAGLFANTPDPRQGDEFLSPFLTDTRNGSFP